MRKANTTVPRGGGVTGRIFVDGRQTFTRFIANLDSIGVRGSMTANVTVGSFIDFAVDPMGIKPLVGADSIYGARRWHSLHCEDIRQHKPSRYSDERARAERSANANHALRLPRRAVFARLHP